MENGFRLMRQRFKDTGKISALSSSREDCSGGQQLWRFLNKLLEWNV
jgi:hypothetical protein